MEQDIDISADNASEKALVKDRVCGECKICCITLPIDQPTLKKDQDVPCKNLSGNGCSIYKSRPIVCQKWYCGWRYLPHLDDLMRPDRSNILISNFLVDGKVTFTALNDPYVDLINQGILTLFAELYEMGIKVFISFKVREGYEYAEIDLFSSEVYVQAQNAGDLQLVKELMRKAIEFGFAYETDPMKELFS